MLSDNIRKIRKSRQMSQEDLAVQLHVVRQTLSKWENAQSVPDADQLIALAEILSVGVHELLGTEIREPEDVKDIAAELAKANAQIAQYAEERRLLGEAGKLRGWILFLTMTAIAVTHIVGNEIFAAALSSVLMIAVLIILYRNLSLLSVGFRNPGKTGSITAVTIFNIVLLAFAAVSVILMKTGIIRFGEKQEELFAAALISAVMLFTGIIASRLPYNRHTGLRLPWTVQNEGAWNIAHKVLGIISIPLGLAYLSLAFFTNNMETLTLIVLAIWICVPGLISLFYVYQPAHKE